MAHADLYLRFKRFNEQDEMPNRTNAQAHSLTLQQQTQQQMYQENQDFLHNLSRAPLAADRRRSSLEDRNAGYIEFEKLRKAQKDKNELVRQELFSNQQQQEHIQMVS